MTPERKAALRKALEEAIESKVTWPGDGMARCPDCLGTGHSYNGFQDCQPCEGTGYLLIRCDHSLRFIESLRNNLTTLDWCPECSGKINNYLNLQGWHPGPCPKCTPGMESLCAVFLKGEK